MEESAQWRLRHGRRGLDAPLRRAAIAELDLPRLAIDDVRHPHGDFTLAALVAEHLLVAHARTSSPRGASRTPSCNASTRSARSASARLWVTTTSARPCSRVTDPSR